MSCGRHRVNHTWIPTWFKRKSCLIRVPAPSPNGEVAPSRIDGPTFTVTWGQFRAGCPSVTYVRAGAPSSPGANPGMLSSASTAAARTASQSAFRSVGSATVEHRLQRRHQPRFRLRARMRDLTHVRVDQRVRVVRLRKQEPSVHGPDLMGLTAEFED